MAQIPVPTQLSRQDFPDAPNWISKLLYPLQLFMTSVKNALTNQLTFQDNFSCVVQYFTLVAGTTDSLNTFSFPFPFGRQPIELSIHASPASGSYEVLFVVASWNYVNGNIVINGISGLTNTVKYNFVVKVS